MMLPRWSRAIANLSRAGLQSNLKYGNDCSNVVLHRTYAKVAAAAAADSVLKGFPNQPSVWFKKNLKLFFFWVNNIYICYVLEFK